MYQTYSALDSSRVLRGLDGYQVRLEILLQECFFLVFGVACDLLAVCNRGTVCILQVWRYLSSQAKYAHFLRK